LEKEVTSNTCSPTQGTQKFKEKGSLTPRRIIFGSYMLCMIIALTLSLIFWRRIFDPCGKKTKHLQEKEECELNNLKIWGQILLKRKGMKAYPLAWPCTFVKR